MGAIKRWGHHCYYPKESRITLHGMDKPTISLCMSKDIEVEALNIPSALTNLPHLNVADMSGMFKSAFDEIQ